MSRKPFDLDRALATLRAETPPPEAAARALAALRESLPLGRGRGGVSTRRSLARPLAAAMITTALAVVLVMPRSKAGSAWAQTLAATLDAPASHSLSLDAQGRKSMEEWRSGSKRAHVLYSKGKPMMEWRDDGRRLYNYAGMFGDPTSPNGRNWGMVSQSAGRANLMSETPYGSSEVLLRQPGVEVLAHDEATGTKPETYRLRVPGPFRGTAKRMVIAEIEPEAHRIQRLTYARDAKGGTVIDYPSSIPASVFEPRPQRIIGVDVYDSEEQTATVQRTLRRGMGKRGPVTLRLVALDGDGTLWVFWTGALPDAKLTRKVRIPGIAATDYATKKSLTSDYRLAPHTRYTKNVTGERIGGMSFVPKSRLGKTVDLDVPYPGGVARFRNVPILRIGLYNHIESLLGVYIVYAPVK